MFIHSMGFLMLNRAKCWPLETSENQAISEPVLAAGWAATKKEEKVKEEVAPKPEASEEDQPRTNSPEQD